MKDNKLIVKKSTLPGAGKGLFTKNLIPAGTQIVEYKGKITSWKEVSEKEVENGYLLYVTRNHVINARPYTKAFGRYANDAKGFGKIKGLRNNSIYVTDKKQVFIEAIRDIQPGEEILVDYGKEYWKTMRENMKIAKKAKK